MTGTSPAPRSAARRAAAVVAAAEASPSVRVPWPAPAAHPVTRSQHARLSRRAALARLDRMPAGARLYFEDVAGLAGVERPTLKHYLYLARLARAAGTAGPRHLPEPDGYEAGTRNAGRDEGTGGAARPWYHPATIRPWIAARQPPGRTPNDGGKPVRRTENPARPGPKPRTTSASPD